MLDTRILRESPPQYILTAPDTPAPNYDLDSNHIGETNSMKPVMEPVEIRKARLEEKVKTWQAWLQGEDTDSIAEVDAKPKGRHDTAIPPPKHVPTGLDMPAPKCDLDTDPGKATLENPAITDVDTGTGIGKGTGTEDAPEQTPTSEQTPAPEPQTLTSSRSNKGAFMTAEFEFENFYSRKKDTARTTINPDNKLKQQTYDGTVSYPTHGKQWEQSIHDEYDTIFKNRENRLPVTKWYMSWSSKK
jgi:hypothetical protein